MPVAHLCPPRTAINKGKTNFLTVVGKKHTGNKDSWSGLFDNIWTATEFANMVMGDKVISTDAWTMSHEGWDTRNKKDNYNVYPVLGF